MLGTVFIISACLIVIAVLYGHHKRESFTNIRGPFPKWVDVLGYVRNILDEQFEYDAVAFSELVDKQGEFVENEDIVGRMNTYRQKKSKYLPKSFVLNKDTPFDTRMAMLYADRGEYVEEMKKPTDVSKLVDAYAKYNVSIASAQYLKHQTISRVFEYCHQQKIIVKLKEKSFVKVLTG